MKDDNVNMNMICNDEISRLDREAEKGNQAYIQSVLRRTKWDMAIKYVHKIRDHAHSLVNWEL